MDLEPNKNQPFWIRVKVPRSAPAGIYTGGINQDAQDYKANVVLRSASNVFHTEPVRSRTGRRVLDKYWASFSASYLAL
jgi:hypothetical protein